jgi:hypothetical protein
MRTRTEWLTELLALTCSPDDAAEALASFACDREALVQLRRAHVSKALRGFLARAYTEAEVERWAEVAEGRDDIGLDPADATALKEVIFELASPELEGVLTDDRAEALGESGMMPGRSFLKRS